MDLEHILDIAFGFRKSKALLTAVELRVFEILAEGPQYADVLTRRMGLQDRGARDFLDALVALGLLERDGSGSYSNSPGCSAFLDPRQPTYIGGLLEYLNGRMYLTWSHLTTALREGKPQSGLATAGGFQAFYSDDVALNTFLAGMTGGSRLVGRSLADQFPWHKYRTVIDIGTAQGCVPAEITMKHRHLTGGGFDLPTLRQAFESYVHKCGLSRRLAFYPGDFFADPLPAADVLIMGRVLHDWDLPERKLLLEKALAALPQGGVLIVHETFIDNARRARSHSLLASLNMLLQTDGGSEFTEAECQTWMHQAGFCDTRIVPLAVGHSAVIAEKN
jgi:hypothetical protein